jgi:hypothetical protein
MFDLPSLRAGFIPRLGPPCLGLLVFLIAAAACGPGPDPRPQAPAGTVAVSVTVSGAGRVEAPDFAFSCRSQCTLLVEEGDRVALRAVPDGAHHMIAWDGPCDPFDATCSLTAAEGQVIGVAFAPHVLRLRVQGDGQGLFEIHGRERTDCRGSCAIGLERPLQVAIYYFGEGETTAGPWTGACEGEDPAYCLVDVDGLVEVGRSWSKPPSAEPEPVTVTIEQSTGGTITAQPSAPYVIGDSVTFTATPEADYQHTSWGGACQSQSAGQPCTLELQNDITVSATFTRTTQPPPPPVTVTIEQSTGGTITAEPSAPYVIGDSVTFTATPEADYQHTSWGGACQSQSAGQPCTLELQNDITVSATFELVPLVTLSVSILGDGRYGVSIDPPGIYVDPDTRRVTVLYEYGTEVTLTVDRPSSFEGWGGDCSDNRKSTTCELTLDRNMEVSATF